MAGLREACAALGWQNVATYIQSGNVVFSAGRASQATLTAEIESMLRASFAHYDASVVVRGTSEPEKMLKNAKTEFSEEAEEIGLKLGDRMTVNILGRDLTATIEVRNAGDDTLKIDRVQPGCGCTAAPIAPDRVSPSVP